MRYPGKIFKLLAVFLLSALSVLAANSPECNTAKAYSKLLNGWPKTTTSLNYNQREKLFEQILHNPVTGFSKINKYDPQGIIGFCFGRAMAAHLFARAMGLAPSSIKKVFIIGALRENGVIVWRFHVTTAVKGEDGKWYTIDPNVGAPHLLLHWMQRMRKIYDENSDAFFYMTPAEAVLPDLRIFNEPDKETAKHIIELSFNPANHEGFKKINGYLPKTWAVSAAAARKFFSTPHRDTANRFSFQDIEINGNKISYNGYFKDFLEFLKSPPTRLASLSMLMKQKSAQGSMSEALPVVVPLSIRFELLKNE